MLNKTFYAKADNVAVGAAQRTISLSALRNIEISLPPLPTQQKIASILSAYDNLIQNYKKQIEALQTAASELYKEWFVRFRFPGWQNAKFENGIPVGWKIERIGNVGEVIGGGTPSTENEEYWDGEIPWLSPVDLSDNTNVYVSRGGKNITKLGLQKSSAKMMPKDTVLLSSRAPVGYVALAKNPICTNQGFKSVVCNTSLIQPIYLYYYFRMNKNYLQSIAGGATFPELSGSMMKKLKVLLPPMKVQQEFSKRAKIFIEKAELLSEQITNLTLQRDLLLPRLMSGKLEVK
jgi:type I restriction enzyme S subunit